MWYLLKGMSCIIRVWLRFHRTTTVRSIKVIEWLYSLYIVSCLQILNPDPQPLIIMKVKLLLDGGYEVFVHHTFCANHVSDCLTSF